MFKIVTQINRAGQLALAWPYRYRPERLSKDSQIDALNDAVRQLGGNPEIEGGVSTINDPLSAPYVLHVDAYIGSDKFVSGRLCKRR